MIPLSREVYFMLKRFENDDFETAVMMFYEIFSNPPWQYDWITKEKITEYFTDMLNTPKAITYTYLNDGEISGVCFGSIGDCAPTPVYEIKEIFIRNDIQNKGLGSKMLEEIEDDLIKNNIAAIRLYTLKTIPAFDFYIKNDFQEISEAAALSKML
jgi:ribosomal protein S18 acetylase RimI-like enzyme